MQKNVETASPPSVHYPWLNSKNLPFFNNDKQECLKRVRQAVPIIYFFFARSISTWICLKIMLLPFLILLKIWTSEFPWEVVQWIGFDFDSNSCFISSNSEVLIKIQFNLRNTHRHFLWDFRNYFSIQLIFGISQEATVKTKTFLPGTLIYW